MAEECRLMAATMPRGSTRPLRDALFHLVDGRSWEQIARSASRKSGKPITRNQVKHLLSGRGVNTVVVRGVCQALGMSEAEAARLQREGESG